jgi:hypothetical protein
MSIAYIALLAVLSFIVLGLLVTLYLMSEFSLHVERHVHKVEMWIQNAINWLSRK